MQNISNNWVRKIEKLSNLDKLCTTMFEVLISSFENISDISKYVFLTFEDVLKLRKISKYSTIELSSVELLRSVSFA